MRKRPIPVLSSLLFCKIALYFVPSVCGQTVINEVAKLTPSDRGPGDRFGISVAVSGDYLVVGANFDDDNADFAGSAYVFLFNGSAWVQQDKLLANDGAAWDNFGVSVAISGDYAVVGADFHDGVAINSGAAYVFQRKGTQWVQQAKLLPMDAESEDKFGRAVSISGNRVLVGASQSDDAGPSSGSAYVFRRDGTNWTEEAKLTASGASTADLFGYSVAIVEDVIVAGATRTDDVGGACGGSCDSGSVHVFRRGSEGWMEETSIRASDESENAWFGSSVALRGQRLVVGADRDHHAGAFSGSAYVFEFDGANWVERSKLVPSDASAGAEFGKSLATMGNFIVVGASGNAGFAYLYSFEGVDWVEEARLIASDRFSSTDEFGISAALHGDFAFVGAHLHEEFGEGSDLGVVYQFRIGIECPPAGAIVEDCNNNGLEDICEVAGGATNDCQFDGIPDQCQIDKGSVTDPLGTYFCTKNCSTDCNANGTPDECEAGSDQDCNGNGVGDFCDIGSGTSEDCNANGVPDECESSLDNNDAFTTTGNKLWTIDISAGGQALVGTADDSRFMSGLSFRPDTGELYTVEEDDIRILCAVDASVRRVGSHGIPILDTPAGIAFDAHSNLFLIHDGMLYAINDATGNAIAIGSTALTKGGSLAFGPDGKLYAIGRESSLNGADGLVELDPLTGSIVQVIGALTDRSQSGPFPRGSMGISFSSRGILYLVSASRDLLYRVSLADATLTPVGSAPVSNGSLAIFRDCNGNGVHDSHDVVSGTTSDSDGNGIPDGCPFCGDGICDDLEDACKCVPDCGEPPGAELPGVTCDDQLDNDCDVAVDCDDLDCRFDPVCALPPTLGGPGDLLITSNLRVRRYDGVTGRFLHDFPPGPVVLNPTGIAIGPNGNLYVAGSSSRNVVRYDLVTGVLVDTFVEPESGGLFAPRAISFGPDGQLYVVDGGLAGSAGNKVIRYDGTTGQFVDVFVEAGSGGLNDPADLAFGPDGHLYVTSVETDSILRFDGQTGSFIDVFVTDNSGGLFEPRSLFFHDGMLYVASSTFQAAVLRFDATSGAFVDEFVAAGSGGLRFPWGMGFGPEGDLYVTSELSNHVLRFDGTNGAFNGGFLYGGGGFGFARYLIFQPSECREDGDCDDGDSKTIDTCYTYACFHQPLNRLYVDRAASGANSGTSWANAFTDLQDALDATEATNGPIDIWIARGTYTPDRDMGDRRATFQLVDGVTLYGGFAGLESTVEERDPATHVTLLSGDLSGNDEAGFTNREDNSYHVVTGSRSGVDAPAILDGVYVIGGNANGPDFESGHLDRGGGMVVFDGAPIIRGCTFLGNYGTLGGGIHTEDVARPLIVSSRFIGNSARAGGGMFNHSRSEPRLVNCLFSGNSANDGGAMANFVSSRPTLTNCTLSENVARNIVGGIHNPESTTTLINSILWGNTDSSGTGESAQLGAGNWDINFCCIQGWTGDLGGTGNTGDCQPDFVDADGSDNIVGTEDDNLHVMAGSPTIDVGNNDADTDASLDGLQNLPSTDFDGDLRIFGDSVASNAGFTVDLGLYEFGSRPPLDMRRFVECLSGPIPVVENTCVTEDLDLDGDVDLKDFWILQPLPLSRK